MLQGGPELEIAAGEKCTALARIELKRLGTGELDRRSVGHGHQAVVEQSQAQNATGCSPKRQVCVVGPLVRAGCAAWIEQLPGPGPKRQVDGGRDIHPDHTLDKSAHSVSTSPAPFFAVRARDRSRTW